LIILWHRPYYGVATRRTVDEQVPLHGPLRLRLGRVADGALREGAPHRTGPQGSRTRGPETRARDRPRRGSWRRERRRTPNHGRRARALIGRRATLAGPWISTPRSARSTSISSTRSSAGA